MPRADKQKQPMRIKYDRPYLEALSRHTLQALAKKEGIRANIKTVDIIARLLDREESPTSSSSDKPQGPERSLNEQVRADARIIRIPAPAPAPLPVPERDPTRPYNHLTDREHRHILRQLTEWNNDAVSESKDSEDRVHALQHAQTIMDRLSREVEWTMWTRIAMEQRLGMRLKKDRHLYDGTSRMGVSQQARWKGYVQKDAMNPTRAALDEHLKDRYQKLRDNFNRNLKAQQEKEKQARKANEEARGEAEGEAGPAASGPAGGMEVGNIDDIYA